MGKGIWVLVRRSKLLASWLCVVASFCLHGLPVAFGVLGIGLGCFLAFFGSSAQGRVW